jgi:hypothetical protein
VNDDDDGDDDGDDGDDNDNDECKWKSGCQQAIASLEDGSRGYQREAAEIPMATRVGELPWERCG